MYKLPQWQKALTNLLDRIPGVVTDLEAIDNFLCLRETWGFRSPELGRIQRESLCCRRLTLIIPFFSLTRWGISKSDMGGHDWTLVVRVLWDRCECGARGLETIIWGLKYFFLILMCFLKFPFLTF